MVLHVASIFQSVMSVSVCVCVLMQPYLVVAIHQAQAQAQQQIKAQWPIAVTAATRQEVAGGGRSSSSSSSIILILYIVGLSSCSKLSGSDGTTLKLISCVVASAHVAVWAVRGAVCKTSRMMRTTHRLYHQVSTCLSQPQFEVSGFQTKAVIHSITHACSAR